jgi:hypothetical protein
LKKCIQLKASQGDRECFDFNSVEQLQAKVFAFIGYDNLTMAKPFKRTYQGKALMA